MSDRSQKKRFKAADEIIHLLMGKDVEVISLDDQAALIAFAGQSDI